MIIKIGIELYSKFMTNEENISLEKTIVIDWLLPFIPNKEETFDAYKIMGDSMPDFVDTDLSWHVHWVSWDVVDGVTMPVLSLTGE